MVDCLVIGGNSPIGAALVNSLQVIGQNVAWTSRRVNDTQALPFNLETLEGLEQLPDAQFVAIVAAETKFAACAEEPQRTRKINVEAPLAIATRTVSKGGRVLFFSSIAVHGGKVDRPTEDSQVTPNSVYGVQKLEAEQGLSDLGGEIAILRPAKVITPDFPLFRLWLEILGKGEVITPFSDLLVAPLALNFVASCAARLLLQTGAVGIFQLSARNEVTYVDIAGWLAESIGADPDLILPSRAVGSSESGKLWLPASARMGCARLLDTIDIELPPAKDAVEALLTTQIR